MHGQRIGYIRISTLDQNPDRQLEGAQVSRVFTDKASGKDIQRPQLDALLGYIREGDTLVVHSMDRLTWTTCAAWYSSSPDVACGSSSSRKG